MSGFFARLGEPLEDEERALVRRYLRGLGIEEDVPIEPARDFAAARRVATDPTCDLRWWDAEQRERRRLFSILLAGRSEREALALLSGTLDSGTALKTAASLAAARFGCNDVGLVGAAAGAASEAVYLAELARLAEAAAEHPFRLKEALFTAGRWPLGILDRRYWLL
jgi:hypothetical protein